MRKTIHVGEFIGGREEFEKAWDNIPVEEMHDEWIAITRSYSEKQGGFIDITMYQDAIINSFQESIDAMEMAEYLNKMEEAKALLKLAGRLFNYRDISLAIPAAMANDGDVSYILAGRRHQNKDKTWYRDYIVYKIKKGEFWGDIEDVIFECTPLGKMARALIAIETTVPAKVLTELTHDVNLAIKKGK